MNKTNNKSKADFSLFKLVHMPILELAKCNLKIKHLENLLKEKNLVKPAELKITWNKTTDDELKRIFEEIEKNIGFKNVKLIKKDNEYMISSLEEEQNN